MRVLQLIDSLEAGGAERMAVNLANALSSEIEKSYLCTTRKEGLLKNSVGPKVGYLYLKKNGTLDYKAFVRFNRFIKDENINIIHAHSSSFFLAVFARISNRQVKVVWHDHYGNSEYLVQRPKRILKLASRFFSHSFAVNTQLKLWAKETLNHSSISYLPNFIQLKVEGELKTQLKGFAGKRVVCLANLRPQKDHHNLINGFSKVLTNYPDYTLHCVGTDFKDNYSSEIINLIEALNLSEKVFLYGSCIDVDAILSHCDIGVLASKSEGLPLALLEYGAASLPVISCNVGDCHKVIEHGVSGLLIEKENNEALGLALNELIMDKTKARNLGMNLELHVTKNFSSKAAIDKVLNVYKTIHG